MKVFLKNLKVLKINHSRFNKRNANTESGKAEEILKSFA